MASDDSAKKKGTRTRGGLVREMAYLYEDEAEKLKTLAAQERCSKSELIRRALRLMFKREGL